MNVALIIILSAFKKSVKHLVPPSQMLLYWKPGIKDRARAFAQVASPAWIAKFLSARFVPLYYRLTRILRNISQYAGEPSAARGKSMIDG